MASEPDYSDEIAREIDDEIRRIVEESRDRARTVLAEHIAELHELSGLLIEHETIDRDQFERLLAGEAAESVFHREDEATDDSAEAAGELPRAGCRSPPSSRSPTRCPARWRRSFRPSGRSSGQARLGWLLLRAAWGWVRARWGWWCLGRPGWAVWLGRVGWRCLVTLL